MRFGAFFLMDQLRDDPERQTFEDVVRQAVLADELGYDVVWLAEHHFNPDYGRCPNPLMMAVKIGERTKRIRLGTAVVVLPLTHPLRVAGEAALCDLLTDGRLELGLGSGYAPYEFDAFGVPLDDRRQRFEEGLDVLAGVWRNRRFGYQGTYYQFPEVEVLPRPLQQPHPPIWITAISRQTAAMAGRLGFHVIQTATGFSSADYLRANFALAEEERQRHGHVGPTERALNRFVYVAESQAQAEREAGEAMLGFVRRNVGYFGYATDVKATEEVTLERLLRERVLTLGDPERCVADLLQLHRQVGFTQLLCRTRCRGIPAAGVERSLRLFAEHVMPALRQAAAAEGAAARSG